MHPIETKEPVRTVVTKAHLKNMRKAAKKLGGIKIKVLANKGKYTSSSGYTGTLDIGDSYVQIVRTGSHLDLSEFWALARSY